MTKGLGSQLVKVDIQSAYRTIPVHPEDWNLLGMSWENALFSDTTLPFGLRSALKIFTAVVDAAKWIARQQGVTTILHYLGSPESTECMANVALVLTIFEGLGIPIAWNKLEGPSSVLTFLGIELDTVQGITRLPTQKLQELGRKEIMCKAGLEIPGGKVTTCMQDSQARQNIPQKNV